MDKNILLVKNTKDLIKKEIKAEVLFGTKIARHQINFLYKVFDSIYQSPAQNLFLSIEDPLNPNNGKALDKEKEKKWRPLFDITLPRLTILYTFQNMRRITLAKRKKDIEDSMRTKRLQ